MAEAVTSSSIVKHLASCNKPTRDKALRRLKTWLPSQTQVSDEELRKIWKGLFYCVWHSDKQPVQLELINNLSSLLVSLDCPLSIQYFEVFLITMRREWSGIDYLRLDKFYLLIRRFLHSFFLVMKKNGWDVELCRRLMRVLEERSLFSSDKFPAQGVNYHVSEIFLDELKPLLPVGLEVFDVLLKPFLSVLEKSSDKVLISKIKSSMFDCLLMNGKKLLEMKKAGSGDGDGDDEVEKLGMIALKFGFSTKLFELGSSESCLQGNRKVLFSLHQDFLKLEKDLANAVIEITIPQVSGDVDLDEVPDLVPISEVKSGGDEIMAEEVGMGDQVSIGSAGKKKSKKEKKAAGESKKKSKKKKRELAETDALEDNDDEKENITEEEETLTNDMDSIALNEEVLSNLQMQFEKVAAEAGMDMNGTSCETPVSPVKETVTKKRKRSRSASKKASVSSDNGVVGVGAVEKSGEKSAKKVKFSMKNNLVWKPHSPLPPQDLRLPPSATPRGSALKKGLSPGPIRETAVGPKKVKQRAALKKARKVPKGFPAAIKRLRKLQTLAV